LRELRSGSEVEREIIEKKEARKGHI